LGSNGSYEDVEDDLFDSRATDGLQMGQSQKSEKKTTSTSPKKVQFDEYEVSRDQKDRK